MEKTDENKIDKNSTYNLNGNQFNNNKEIHFGDKIHQEIHDNSVSYELNKTDVSNIETISVYVTKKWGDKKVGLIGIISLASGLITIFSYLNSSLATKIFKWLPSFPSNIETILLIIGIILIFAGIILLNALQYKQYTRCEKCGKDYAYKEYKEPIVREVQAKKGTRQNITKFFECKYCNHKVERKSSRIIPNEEDELE